MTETSFPQASRRGVLAAGMALASAGIVPAAQAAEWPSRPVRVIVPWPPGGTADSVARLLFAETSQRTGQQFVIDNRAGATGMIGSGHVATQPADGYTVLYGTTPLSTSVLFPQITFDPARDLVPVFQAITVPQLLLMNPAVRANSVAEVIADAKARPGAQNWASAGSGGVQHLALELFSRRAGIQVNHIPYRGGGPATNDLVAGQVQYYWGNADTAIAFVQEGRLKALCHTGATQLASLPHLPPLSDTLPGFETYEWNGLFVPAGTPPAIVRRLNAMMNETLATPAVAERLRGLDLQARANTPEQFADFFRSQSARWNGFIQEAGIRLE
ncbi:Bug family tripartite tricarboxylate transporter substrate binding protein [Roseococcus pinisoli]|uniref:Tripartite tricarboxylate transporter substrate binding protein n=1 Tax=Roseococcus pinisoli TaxID=2835040 RepID=A0ABS5QFU3_9PROT|nr:tripartite tricarboxylate transporter substrate binding protein [uncultured Roseococcus sp.]MBS7811792.1 tripartite tricarboxylate transporter substrate binding protein [Roseococcus pinisoli]